MNGNITDVPGILVGSAGNEQALTGCTVVLAGRGAVGGVDVRGSAPGTRETDLLRPTQLVREVHAVVLSGGSAFGLDASSGVMRYLEEAGFGYEVGTVRVPIVPSAILFDLDIGDPQMRPDAEMGYRAAKAACAGNIPQGNVGAGLGATVGKIFGPGYAMKGGLGSASIRLDSGFIVGALVAVNAFGDVLSHKGEVLAGPRNPMNGQVMRTLDLMKRGIDMADFKQANTTIGVVATNAQLDVEGANKVAQMAHLGLARSISPVHTMFDGDCIFSLATGELVGADVSVIGAVAGEVVQEAVERAIKSAVGVYGIPAWQDLFGK